MNESEIIDTEKLYFNKVLVITEDYDYIIDKQGYKTLVQESYKDGYYWVSIH